MQFWVSDRGGRAAGAGLWPSTTSPVLGASCSVARRLTACASTMPPARDSPTARCGGGGLWTAAFIVVLAAAAAEANSNSYWRRENSLMKPYASPHWDFSGSTVVTPNYCRITGDVQSQSGNVWNTLPIGFHDWEVHVHFKIHGRGHGNMQGDGMVIWYAKERMKTGPVFGNEDYFSGLAVMLDTYSNQNTPHRYSHPYVSAMINNGSVRYDHEHDGDGTRLAGCHANVRNRKHDTLIAIRYKDNLLKVSMDIDGKDSWEECFAVSDVQLPTGYYFGLSAATGELSDNHDVISMKLFELQPSDAAAAAAASYDEVVPGVVPSIKDGIKEDAKDQSGSSSGAVGVYILLFVGIVLAGGFAFYRYYRKNTARRRLY